MDVIAANAPAEARDVLVVLDAKRGQVFAARFGRGPNGKLLAVAEPELIEPAKAVARAWEDGVEVLHVMGEGIDYHRSALGLAAAEAGERVVEVARELWVPRSVKVHELGRKLALAGRFTRPEAFLPTYIRLAEAEEVWRKKHGQ